jgi:hypothetical protein
MQALVPRRLNIGLSGLKSEGKRCAGLQIQMRDDALDHLRLANGGNDLQLAGKLPAVSDG